MDSLCLNFVHSLYSIKVYIILHLIIALILIYKLNMDSVDIEFEGTITNSLKNVRYEDTGVNIIDVHSEDTEGVPIHQKKWKNVKRSIIWNHFERLKCDPKDPYAKHRYCIVVYASRHSKRNGTGL